MTDILKRNNGFHTSIMFFHAIIFIFVQCFTNTLSNEYKLKQIINNDRHVAKVLLDNEDKFSYNNTTRYGNILKTSPYSTQQKWQIKRLTRKHYEIVNVLLRKTKMFVNIESTTSHISNNNIKIEGNKSHGICTTIPLKYILDKSFKATTYSLPVILVSTPSYIEFYYLDEVPEHNLEPKHKALQNSKHEQKIERKNENNRFILFYKTTLPAFSYMKIDTHPFHEALTKIQPETPIINCVVNKKSTPSDIYMSERFNRDVLSKNKIYTTNINKLFTKSTTSNSRKVPATTENISSYYKKLTTFYDRIKFFELYDKNTRRFQYKVEDKEENILLLEPEKETKGNKNDKDQSIILENVNLNVPPHNINNTLKFAKKHVQFSDTTKETFSNSLHPKLTMSMLDITPKIAKTEINTTTRGIESPIKFARTFFNKILKSELFSNSSRFGSWSDYPFVAVYIYEPSQVHCEAAAISPHWLVSAGACLCRHRKDPPAEGRSAFVTYCGESWRYPERVAYVKYSLVHPRYHPRDRNRRHLYNIGLIQVVTSMSSACSNWSPVSLMSHQFVADQGGSTALAVGWGIDRYGTRYAPSDLPKWPLMIYESIVYSESCPGSTEYGKEKYLNEEIDIRNVYCLSLPPYAGEQNDPVHGGLLLVGGKLIALYLQEERRPGGEQSAQYTGIWRLIPWLLDVAREPDDSDSFPIEI